MATWTKVFDDGFTSDATNTELKNITPDTMGDGWSLLDANPSDTGTGKIYVDASDMINRDTGQVLGAHVIDTTPQVAADSDQAAEATLASDATSSLNGVILHGANDPFDGVICTASISGNLCRIYSVTSGSETQRANFLVTVSEDDVVRGEVESDVYKVFLNGTERASWTNGGTAYTGKPGLNCPGYKNPVVKDYKAYHVASDAKTTSDQLTTAATIAEAVEGAHNSDDDLTTAATIAETVTTNRNVDDDLTTVATIAEAVTTDRSVDDDLTVAATISETVTTDRNADDDLTTIASISYSVTKVEGETTSDSLTTIASITDAVTTGKNTSKSITLATSVSASVLKTGGEPISAGGADGPIPRMLRESDGLAALLGQTRHEEEAKRDRERRRKRRSRKSRPPQEKDTLPKLSSSLRRLVTKAPKLSQRADLKLGAAIDAIIPKKRPIITEKPRPIYDEEQDMEDIMWMMEAGIF